MNSIWGEIFCNNSIRSWLSALGVLLGCLVSAHLLRYFVSKYLKNWTSKTSHKWDDFFYSIIEKSIPLLYLGSIYISKLSLQFNPKTEKILHIVLLVFTAFFILRIVTSAIRHFIFSFIQKRENSELRQKQARGLVIILNIVIWIIGFVFLIDNLGYNVTTLITGLGIGGIAIALAAQTILGDLFNYFVIFFDKPFEPGDFIVVDDKMGTVEYVGLKTTRIRTLGGEQLICSNTNLTNSRLHNYKRMSQRRVVFRLGIIYQTPHEVLQRIPEIVHDIILSKESVTFDRGHFSGFGASSLDFEFVYFVISPDYNFHMDVQQSIYLDIVKTFEHEKIEFAYPTQSLFIQPASK